MAFGWLQRTCDIDDLHFSFLAVQPRPIHHLFFTRSSRDSNNKSDMADDKENEDKAYGYHESPMTR